MHLEFWIPAIFSVLGALGMVFSNKPVYSAMSVAFSMLNLAVLYAVLEAVFLSLIQVIVYTGAVMMLFLFVLMVVGVDTNDNLKETIKGQRLPAVLGGLGMGALMISLLGDSVTTDAGLGFANSADGSNMQGLGLLIFGKYVFAFELTSALLITAAVGAMVLAHREHHTKPLTQADRMLSRFKVAGTHRGSLPGPGVYARHNAVDTPALLPDGSLSEISVPKPLAARGVLKSIDTAASRGIAAIAAGDAVVGDESLGKDEV
jgi:NADH-quinone oxidoreductase subunit J